MAASKPILTPGAWVVELDGEKVVYLPDEERLHHLNHSASVVVELCDGSTTVREMAEEVADVYEMPFAEVYGQIKTAVKDLSKAGVITRRPRVPVHEPAGAEHPVDADERDLVRMQVPRTD